MAVPETIAALMLAFEHSGLGHAARSTTWLYPLANLIHVLGAALLVGAIATFDIQVLRKRSDLNIVGRATIPLAAFGVVLQVASGIVLLSAEASTLVRNPAFQFKMVVLVLGLANVALFHRRFVRRLKEGMSLEGGLALAGISLISWVLVLLAGRAIAYL